MSRLRGIALFFTVALLGAGVAYVGPALAIGQTCSTVTPSHLVQGVSNQTLKLAGSYPAPVTYEVTFTPADGITIVSTTKVSSSQIDVVVNVAANAATAPRTVAVKDAATSDPCETPVTVGPEITAVGGAVSNASDTGSITVTGRGFQPGASVNISKAAYGFGGAETDEAAATNVVVNGDRTQLTASAPTRGRAPGRWKVTVINPDGGSVSFGDGSATGQLITGGQPTLTSLEPAGIGQGASATEFTATGTNLARGVLFTVSGSGVTQAAAATWESLTKVKVKLSATGAAPSGPRDVTLTNTDDQTSTKAGALLVSAPPALSGSSPTSIGQGATAVAFSASGNNFQAGAAPSYSGLGVTVTAGTVTPTSISGTMDVAQDAATGARDLTVTNPDGGSATRPSALEVVTGPKPTSVNPSSRPRGTTVTLDINGTFPANTMEVLFDPPTGITIQGSPTSTATKITVTVAIATDAPAGPRDVTIRDTATQGRGTCDECFAVSGAPTISTVDPAAVGQGAVDFTVTITGSNFLSGIAVSFSGTGVSTSSVVRDSPTQLTAKVTVTDTAAPGARDVTVTNSDAGTATKPGALTVNAGPKVTTLEPPGRPQGFEGAFVINGSGFGAAPVVEVGGQGVTVNSVIRDGAGKLTVAISVASTAPLTARDVIVRNGDGGRAVCTACFTVAKGPSLTSITPSEASGGSTVSITDLKGNDIQPSPVVTLEREGQAPITMTNVSRPTSSKVTGTFDLTDAAPGRWTVRLTNPDGGSATLPSAFNVVLGAPTVTEVTPTNVSQTATGLKMTIKGSGFAPGFLVTLPDADGATLTEAVRISSTVIEAKISVATNAPLGSRDVRVTNSDTKSGECSACFFVVDGAQPEVMSNFNGFASFDRGGYIGAGDIDGDLDNGSEIVAGANGGGSPHVIVYRVNPDTGAETEVTGFHGYTPAFLGGVRVAVGEFDGDPANGSEIVTGPGPGGGPHVRIFKLNPDLSISEPLGGGFMAYTPEFVGGVYVAGGDIDGDGRDEIIVGAGPGGGPHVRIMTWDITTNGYVEMAGFYAYDRLFSGGVAVAAGNVVPEDGDQKLEAITAPASGGGPHVRLFNQNGVAVREFMAFEPAYNEGVRIAAGDLDFDTVDDVIVARATRSEVALFADEGARGFTLLRDPPRSVYGPNSISGTNVAAHDMDGDGDDDLVTTPDHDSRVFVVITRPL